MRVDLHTRRLALLALVAGIHASCAAAVTAEPPMFVITSASTFLSSPLRGMQTEPIRDSLGTPLKLVELDARQRELLTTHVHEYEARCGGYFAFASREEAEAFLARDRSLNAVIAPAGIAYTIDNQTTIAPWLAEVEADNIYATIAHLSDYQNRYYTSSHGRIAAEWIHDTWLALGNGRPDVYAELFTACTTCSTQPSVILTLVGNELPDEVVVIGAHLDSILSGAGGYVEQRAPGADDDASGIATITETIRIALASGWKPQRTVKFMGYAAEEVGLRGSAAIASRFAGGGVDVVGVLQLDMTNYRSGVAFDLKFLNDYSNGSLLSFAGSIFDTYLVPLGLVRSTHSCGYACSDHASWTAAGYPAVMATEAGGLGEPFFRHLHTVNDLLANMGDSAENSAKFARFSLAFLGELAKTSATGDPPIFNDGFEQ